MQRANKEHLTQEEINPFFRNYLFSKKDLERCTLTFEDKLRVLFRPMLVQTTSDGLVVSYKIDAWNRIYLFDIKQA